MSERDELKKLAEARSRSWWFLSRFYLERPKADFLSELREVLSEVPPAEDDPAHALLESLAADPEVHSERLLLEFTRLFRGIKENYGPPPPFECLYRGYPMMGEPALAVIGHYREAGFDEVAPEVGPQDHLGAELRFLSFLCYREMEAWADDDSAAARERIGQEWAFLDQHLLSWVPEYTERISRESREPFYKAAVALTRALVLEDRALLDELTEELETA